MMMTTDHTHRCVHCGHEWACILVKCKVDKATKANHDGPWCGVCQHLVTAIRVAAVQSLPESDLAQRLRDLITLNQETAHG